MVAVDPAKLKAADVIKMLRRHYQIDDKPYLGVFASEIESPCKTRRADLIWAPTTIAGGSGLIGHEVKVTRSDLMIELMDPSKADPWSQFCDQWWLVVSDPKIVDGLMMNIPAAWGIMAPPSGRSTRSMTILRQAPQLNPKNAAAGYRRLVAWQIAHYGNRVEAAEFNGRDKDRKIKALETELAEAQRGNLSGMRKKHFDRIEKLVSRVEAARQDVGIWWFEKDLDDEIVACAIDLAGSKKAAADVRQRTEWLIDELDRVRSPYDDARQLLAKTLRSVLDQTQEAA